MNMLIQAEDHAKCINIRLVSLYGTTKMTLGHPGSSSIRQCGGEALISCTI